MDSITVTPQWVKHWSGDFWALQFGHITLAAVTARISGGWRVTSDFFAPGGGLSCTASDEQAARALAEAHARRVLGAEKDAIDV